MMRNPFARFQPVDWLLVLSALTLLFLGLSAIYSVDLSQGAGGLINVKKQLLALGLGGLLALPLAFSNIRLFHHYTIPLYALGILSLVAVLFAGTTIRGTTGWFSFGPLHIQPVEFMKLALAVALARYFGERARRLFGWRELIESGAITVLPVLLTLGQPDLGSALVLLGMWMVCLPFAGIGWRQVLVVTLALAVLAALAWGFFLADYQRARLLTFAEPASDPLGEGYNVRQAIIAVGAGGWLGRGLGFGSQSQLKFIPESQTDFIFAVIAEELGLLGSGLILAGFFILLYRIFIPARRSPDGFSAFLLLAIGSVFFLQFTVNVGMNLGFLPVTGISLPLVSYGGSSLVVSLVMLAMVQSAARRRLA